MKLIPLTKGKFAMVDDADYEAVSQFKWCAWQRGQNFYAIRSIRKPNGKIVSQYLHRFLMPGVPRVDHRDGNSLNDQMENLRPATYSQNGQGSQRKRLGTTSQFRGVSWNKQCGKWEAAIKAGGKKIYLGRFALEVDAARARDAGALKYHGDFASLNFP